MTLRFILLLTLMAAHTTPAAEPPKPILGFKPQSAAAHFKLEANYEALLNSRNLEQWMRQMTSRPHHAGSPKTKENAEFIAQLFRSWGYATEIETFYVLFPTPKSRHLEILQPRPETLSLTEEIISSDSAAAALRAEGLPPYNAYSADGDVSGPLVYVNRGLPEDYEVLERFGIDVKGKIVLARYGNSWRGIKPKVAHEKGAIGCIIFNDPGDDGFTQGAVYPEGAFKHDTAVQRGSVVDLPLRPGDPLTPFRGATQNANRLSRAQASTIMKIPVLPVSSMDGEKLLRALEGPVVPEKWRGALPVTYRFGGSTNSSVRLKLEFNWDTIPAYNVIARLTGSLFPDQWILRGNHHDAWVIGARDPMSGLVPLLEQARAFSALHQQSGWRPKRTLIFCAWDAEEPGLLGSVEWCEHHAVELREKAVVYLNSDNNSRGFLSALGSHALETLVAQTAHEIIDPQTGASISDRLRALWLVQGSAEEKKLARARRDLYLGALGSGSDYSPFLQYLGIASFDIRFRGEGLGGEYHTSFDTFDHYSRFVDPGFDYSLALTRTCGRLILRLADAEILPFDFRSASDTYSRYAAELSKLADDMRSDTEQFNQQLAQNQFKLAADPELPFHPPQPKADVPHLNFAPLQNALVALRSAADHCHQSIAQWTVSTQTLSTAALTDINRAILSTERMLIHENGLPRRPWFRHQVYAPGFYTGYGVKTFPGIREAIEERRWTEAETEILNSSTAIQNYANLIRKTAQLIGQPPAP